MNSQCSQRGPFRALRLGAAVAMLVATTSAKAQDKVLTHFEGERLSARSNPATITTDDENTLSGKGYIKTGRATAWKDGTGGKAEARELLEAAILNAAAEAGGDLVRMEKELGVEKNAKVQYTGKTVKVCKKYEDTSYEVKVADVTQLDPNNKSYHSETRHASTCTGGWSEEDDYKMLSVTSSEASVWRYEPARIAEAAKTRRDLGLLSMLGQNIKSADVQDFLGKLSTPKIKKSDYEYIYYYKQDGLGLDFARRSDLLTSIRFYAATSYDLGIPFQAYRGELPAGLSFHPNREELASKCPRAWGSYTCAMQSGLKCTTSYGYGDTDHNPVLFIQCDSHEVFFDHPNF